MAKDKFSRTKACATKTLYAVMKEMSRRGGSMPAKELYPFVNDNVELTDWEKEPEMHSGTDPTVLVYGEGLRGLHGKPRTRHVPHGLEHL